MMENGQQHKQLVNGHNKMENGHDGDDDAEKCLTSRVYKEFNLISQFLTPDALTNTYYNYEKIESIARWLLSKTEIRPRVAIICGSGLGGIGEIVENKHVIPYSQIPEFPKVTINGHNGNLIFGTMGAMPVVCMQGRFHSYEGYTLAVCCMPVKLFKLLGCSMMLATNAAGSLNPTYEPGDLMVIKDHFSVPMLTMQHPLMGPNDARFGDRFVPANKIYDRELRRLFLEAARRLNVRIHEGVYGVIGGPAYESVTDARFLQNQGCDCSGMSTSHESMVASYCGMKVLAFSIITNRIVTEFDADEIVDHNEVVKVANKKALEAEKLVSYFISTILDESNIID